MRIKIKVTDDHQQKGQRIYTPTHSSRCDTCPIALAIHDVVKPGVRVQVLNNYVNIGVGDIGSTKWNPPIWLDIISREAVALFDRLRYRKKVYDELWFTLDIPVEYLREEYVG